MAKMKVYTNIYSRFTQGAIAIGFVDEAMAKRKAKESQEYMVKEGLPDRVVAVAIPMEIDYPTD